MTDMNDFFKSMKLGDSTSIPSIYLDTGFPPLNKIISGSYDLGFPSGRVAMIAGPSGSGKTMICTQLMISAQQMGGYAAFFDHEYAYHTELAQKQGLNVTDKNKFYYHEGDTYEDSISLAFKIGIYLRTNKLVDISAPIVFIFDSLAAMVPKKKDEKDISELTMNDSTALSRVTSQTFPDIAKTCKKYNLTMIFINQLRDNVTLNPMSGGPSTTYPGGKSSFFYCSTVIALTGKHVYAADRKTKTGRTIIAMTDKTRSIRPWQTVEWNFSYNEDGTGFMDSIGSYAEYLKNIGAIKSNGTRVFWEGGSPYLSQVKEDLRNDPLGMEKLEASQGLFNFQIIRHSNERI